MKLSIKVIDNFKNIHSLENTWERFSKIPESFTLEELAYWWESLALCDNNKTGYRKKLIILIAEKDKKPLCILPLVMVERIKKRLLRVRCIEFLSQSFGGVMMDIIETGILDDELYEIFDWIRDNFRFHYINLSYLPEHSRLVQALQVNSHFHSAYMTLPLDMAYEEIRTSLYSKNLRHILNKFNRRIREYKQKINNQILFDKDEIQKFSGQIQEVSLSKLKDNGMHSHYNKNQLGNYLFSSILRKENPFCSIYELEGELLAYNLGFISDKTIYAIDASYNRDFIDARKIGFGILAYDNIIKTFSEKCNLLNMGHGIDNYKFRFTKEYTRTFQILIPGNKFLSKFHHTLLKKKIKQDEQSFNRLISGYE